MIPHSVASYDQELDYLTDLLARMGGQAEKLFSLSLNALERRNESLAAMVIQGDAEVDDSETRVNAQVLRLLALRAPVADDLRRVLVALKIARALERTADHARRLARMVLVLNRGPALPLMIPLLHMGRLVERFLRQCLNAYLAGDVLAARALHTRDEAVDQLDSNLSAATIDHMRHDPDTIPLCAQILFASRTIERVGNHAAVIAAMTALEKANADMVSETVFMSVHCNGKDDSDAET